MAASLAPSTDPTTPLAALCHAVLPVWSRHLAEAQAQSTAAVQEMLAAFGHINTALGRLHAARDGVDARRPDSTGAAADLPAQIERMYRSFQYEDRVGQMLALLRQDMDRLLQASAQDGVLPDATQWLQRLQSEYAMAEQRAVHNTDSASGTTPRGEGTGSDAVDFF